MFITVATVSAKGLMLGFQRGEIPGEKPNSLPHLSICVLLATLQHLLAAACIVQGIHPNSAPFFLLP